MEQVEDRIDQERQLHNLRMGLKVVCAETSLLLLAATWFAMAQCAGTREILSELGSVEMPGIVKLAFLLVDVQTPLLIASLVMFLAVLFCGVRYRNAVFLFAFALHLLIGGLLIIIMTLSSKLAMANVIQGMSM